MKKNKLMAMLLAVMMVIMLLPQGAFALTKVYDPDDRLPDIPEGYYYYGESYTDENDNIFFYISKPEGEYGIAEGYWIDEYGYRADDEMAAAAIDSASEPATEKSASQLPESYDGRDYGLVTAVESQISGTCWAHAAIAALESNAILQGLADNTIDLNEYHTVWNCANGYYDGVKDSKNDGYVASSLDGMMANGGTATKAGYALLNFAGAVTEGNLTLTSKNTSALITEMQSKMQFSNKYDREITGIEVINIGTNRDKVKQAILDYGGMYFAYTSYGKGYSHVNVNGEFVTTYFSKGISNSADGNHAVEVIGWDDNFAVENFSQETRPKNPGAWLLKNSWGSGWGSNGGYFWMSYEETTFYSCYAMKAVSTDEYENVFMYDGAGYGKSVSCTAAANIFTADKDVYLTKFSVGNKLNTSYTMSIYKLSDSAADPTDGQLIYKQKGKFNNEKYVDITGNIEIKQGERFSIVIEGPLSCYVEGASSTSRKFTSNTGESFYYTTKWNDSSASGNNNVCIRVVAKDYEPMASYTVKYSCPGNFSVRYTSNDGTVQLPQTDGYTWVCIYNGEVFDGTGVDHDMTVEAHCYPTAGKVDEDCPCVTEYRCIYCGEEQKTADSHHDMKTKLIAVSGKNTGYTYAYCTKCGYETRKNFITMLFSANGTLNDNIHWQYYLGKLSIDGIGAMPDFRSPESTPWAEYIDDIKTIYINRGITYVGENTFTGDKVEKIVFADSVKEIGAYAFTELPNVTSISLPDSLNIIGEGAFYFNKNLKTVSFGSKLTEIGDYAFDSCVSLTEITIPGTVTNLGDYVFNECVNLKKLTIGEGITSLGYSLFYTESEVKLVLDELIIPSTLTGIKSAFFADLYGIKNITMNGANESFVLEDGVLFSSDKKTLFYYTAGKTDVYYNIHDSVTNVMTYAFSGNGNLKFLDMSCDAVTLQQYTIRNCTALTNVNLPKGLTRIYSYAVYNTEGIRKVHIPETLTYLLPYTWIYSTNSNYIYPTLYTAKSISAISRMVSSNSRVTYITNHVDHGYDELLYGADTDCKTASDRILGCDCGDFEFFTGEHCYHWVIDKPATCGENGYMHRMCLICYDIQDSQTVIKANEKHSFGNYLKPNALKSEATCTEPAVYYCSCVYCGKVDETKTFSYGKANGHDFSGECKYNHNYTHTTKCLNCNTWSPATACTWKFVGDDPGPNCITFGLNHYVCEYCSGETDVQNEKVGSHVYENGHCIYCYADDPQASCTCDCHKDGIQGFFWKISCAFYKLFGTHKVCECGKIHY